MKFLFGYKPLVDECVERFLAKKDKELSKVNPWGSDVVARLIPFVTAGKTIRGSLVLYSYLLFRKKSTDFVLDAAAALELFQSGFLIHDDIMDKDDMRRGKPSFHVQYKSNDLAMCVGDLCFFLGYELLPLQVRSYVSSELSYVTIAQMQDVAGARNQKDILTLYRYKTARYSFSVPLAVGALLATVDSKTISMLEALGEDMGILFQIRDDELDGKQGLAEVTKKELMQKAHTKISELPIPAQRKKELAELVAFCQNREA